MKALKSCTLPAVLCIAFGLAGNAIAQVKVKSEEFPLSSAEPSLPFVPQASSSTVKSSGVAAQPKDAAAKADMLPATSAAISAGSGASERNAGLANDTGMVFTLTPSDNTVRAGLSRWMRQVGYQDVVWKVGRDIPVERELRFEGGFWAALDDLVTTLRYGANPVRACVYTNQVIQVIPKTKFCEDSQ